jgi:hypothetical protein
VARKVWITATAAVATAVAIVVNFATDGGAWWLWLILVALVGVTVVMKVRSAPPPAPQVGPEVKTQQISATRNALVEDSPQVAAGSVGSFLQKIRVRRGGTVRRSGQRILRK